MGQFAVIGLGRFGSSTSLELVRLGHSVLGIDANHKLVAQYADELTHAVIVDATDKHALEELALENYDVVLVAIGSDIEASLVCVVHLKSLGVKTIWVTASSTAHHLILNKLGVARIIHPEEEMGLRIAQALSYPMVNDYISLGNGEFVVEIHVSQHLEGEPLHHFIDGPKGRVHALAIRRKTELFVHPDVDFQLAVNDVLVLLGQLEALKTIAPKLI